MDPDEFGFGNSERKININAESKRERTLPGDLIKWDLSLIIPEGRGRGEWGEGEISRLNSAVRISYSAKRGAALYVPCPRSPGITGVKL